MYSPAQFSVRTVSIWLALLSASFAGERAPDRDVKQYTIEEFLRTTRYGGASFSPDKSRILVSSDQTGVFNAYAFPVDGSDPKPLTQSKKESIFAVGYFPDDERFLYTADQGGNELDHLYVREIDGTSVDLTPGKRLKASFYGWAKDDETFYVGTNERDPRYFDVYQYRVDDYKRELVFQNDGGYQFGSVSPNGQAIALMKIHTRDNSDIYLFDRTSKKLTHLTPHEGEINHAPEAFSPDGKSLYLTTDHGSEFMYLVKHDLDSGARKVVEKVDWDVSFASFSKHGKFLVVGINQDARTKLKVYEAATMRPVALPDIDGANVNSISISRDESRVALYASSARMPSDLFYFEFSAPTPRQLTRSLSPNIDASDLVEGKVVRFKSFDGLEIPGILYKPHQASSDNKVPALVWIHGGPGGQSRIGYRALIQYLVNHGYAIYAINNRGSSGYGKTFQQLDDRKHGEGDLDDCVASKKMLIQTGFVDPKRIGVIGGSYGGYMVLAALAFRPLEFEVGVDIFGVANWYRTVQSIPPWWESMRAALEKEMGDFDDKAYFQRISPLFHAEKIRRPLIVLQGANDPRVLKVESDEIVAKVKQNGVDVDYIVFDDEGHGFLKKKNQTRGYREVLRFLDKHLKKGGDSG